MEEENNIDKIFQDHLEGFEAAPSEKVWTSIDGKLDKKNKSRGFGLFWIVLLAGVISFGTYEYVRMDMDSAPSKVNIQVPEVAGSHATVSAKKTTGNAVETQEKTSEKQDKKIAEKSLAAVAENPASINSSPRPETPARVADSNTGNAGRKAFRNSSIEPSRVEKNQEHGIVASSTSSSVLSSTRGLHDADDQKNQSEQNVVSPIGNNKTDEQENASEKNSAEQKQQTPAAAVVVNLQPSVPATNDPSANSVPANTAVENTAVENSKPGNIIERTNTPEMVISSSPDSAVTVPASEKIADPATAQSKGLKAIMKKIASHSSIALFYSPDYAGNRTTGVNNAESVTPGYSWSSGFKFGYDISKRLSISAGANYSFYTKSESYSSIFVTSDDEYKEMHEGDHDHGYEHGHDHGGNGGGSHDDEDDEGPGEDGNHYVVHTSGGDIDLSDLPPESTGDEESGETLSINSVVSSSVEFINIPLKLRFNFINRKLIYYAEAGASIGFIVNSNAKISIQSYTENSVVRGLTNHQYSALLNLGVEYRLYRGIGIFLEPNLRYSFTPLNDSGSSKSYPYFIGCNAGLSIHF